MSKPTGNWEDDHDRDDLARYVRSVKKPDPALSTLDKVRKVAEEHQCNRVNGVLLDAFTAHVIVKVYDALNEKNKARLAAMPVRRMAEVALSLAAR